MNILLVIDTQEYFKKYDLVKYNKILNFIKESKNINKYDLIISSKLKKKNKLINNFTYCNLEFNSDIIIEKTGYGLPTKFYSDLKNEYQDGIFNIVGISCNNSIQKISLDLFDRELKSNILNNYIININL